MFGAGLVPAQNDGDIMFDDAHEWVVIKHESGVKYCFRTKSIIGFSEPVPGDPKGRNGVLLQTGGHVFTDLDLDAFVVLLKDHPNVKIKELIKK